MTKIVNSRAVPFKTSGPKKRLNLKKFNIVLFSLIAILGAVYLVDINDLTVQGFALQELKAEAAYLSGEKASNEEKVNIIQSYYSLNERTAKLNMVAIDNVEYLAVNRSDVARK
ncbi:MAG: hypothetical protein WC545_00095 [Patescibacteria group bacterium]|jgi:CBS domain containing-hemolysin-like protein